MIPSSNHSGMKFSGGLTRRLIDFIYPLGSVIASVNSAFDPNTAYKHQTWVRFAEGKTLVGVDSSDEDFSTVESTGGEKTHTLTVAEMPSHNHTFSVRATSGTATAWRVDFQNVQGQTTCTNSTGGGGAHNNMPPYAVVYYWKRTA